MHAKRTRRESAQASNFTGNTRLGTRRQRRRRRWLQHRSKRVKGCCCIAPVVPLRPSCNALTQAQLSPFPLSRVHRALSPLALNMLLRASCQRRSKVPSPTTYCRDTLFFFPFFSLFFCFLSLSLSLFLPARLYTRSFSPAACATENNIVGFFEQKRFFRFRSTMFLFVTPWANNLRNRLQNHLYHSPHELLTHVVNIKLVYSSPQ